VIRPRPAFCVAKIDAGRDGMSRATVRKVFLLGLVLAIVGAVLAALTMRGGQAESSTVYAAGIALAGIGALIEVISWILALISVALLGRWGWFVVMLILGVIGLLLIVMVVYSFVGPTSHRNPRQQMSAG
jgi:hypothetical protein